MKKLLLLFAFAPLFIVSSCEKDDNQIVCSQGFVYGLNVVVLDATTGNPLVEGVQVTAVDGSYHEVLYNLSGMEYEFFGAGERIGNYTVTVTKEGYQIYTSAPIGVSANECHVNPQSLTVNLQSN